jgi:hypothetical protein
MFKTIMTLCVAFQAATSFAAGQDGFFGDRQEPRAEVQFQQLDLRDQEMNEKKRKLERQALKSQLKHEQERAQMYDKRKYHDTAKNRRYN